MIELSNIYSDNIVLRLSMRIIRISDIIVVPVCFLLLFTVLCGAQPGTHNMVDENSVAEAARVLRAQIFHAVTEAGGDLEHQHLHLVLAFSTGHFSTHPIAAQTARQLAWLLARDTLIAGDRVTCYAWEMSVWNHRSGEDKSVVVSDSRPEAKTRLQELFPLTAQSGSRGGHDTERAIVEITKQVGDATDVVIVLITNDAHSVAPKGTQTIGADNSEYLRTLQNWTRLSQTSPTGAWLRLSYNIINAQGQVREQWLDIVAVLPIQYKGKSITGNSRSVQLRTSSTPTFEYPRQTLRARKGYVIALLVFGVFVVIASLFLYMPATRRLLLNWLGFVARRKQPAAIQTSEMSGTNERREALPIIPFILTALLLIVLATATWLRQGSSELATTPWHVFTTPALLAITAALVFLYPYIWKTRYLTTLRLSDCLREMRQAECEAEYVVRTHAEVVQRLHQMNEHLSQDARAAYEEVRAQLKEKEKELEETRRTVKRLEQAVASWEETAEEYIDSMLRLIELSANSQVGRKSLEDFLHYVQRHGFSIIAPKPGHPFIPELHEGVGAEDCLDVEPGRVVRCTRWGYAVNGEVRRRAEVVLATTQSST